MSIQRKGVKDEKIKVTFRYLDDIVGGIGFIQDKEGVYLYDHLDHNDKKAVKEIIKKYIPECFDSYSDFEKKILKTDLSYYLTITEHQTKDQYPYFEEKYENADPCFDLPDDPRDFYVQTWEVLFPGRIIILRI